jgi:hypothetical protein
MPMQWTGLTAAAFFLLVCYFLPTLVGIALGKRSVGPIFALNLLLGWTLVGWIVALMRSLSVEPEPKTIDLQSWSGPALYTQVPFARVCPNCRAPLSGGEVYCPKMCH